MTEGNKEQVLKTGNYEIEFSNGPCKIYRVGPDEGPKEWVCTCPDYEIAMGIVEGLILVEHKRFYHPESTPKMDFQRKKEANHSLTGIPPFFTTGTRG